MPLKRKYKKVIFLSAIIVIIYGLYALSYWAGLQAEVFDPAIGGQLPMAVDSAVSFILLGLSLLLRSVYRSPAARLISRVCAVAVLTWSILFLIRDFTPLEIPLIFGMSPQTAFCFLCLSVAFLLIKRHGRRHFLQWTLHLVTLISSIVIIGHLLDIPEFYHMTFIPMAIYTAVGFLLLSVSASLINHSIGITALFTGNLMGNIMARRLFLKLFIAILAIGYIRILAHRRNWISTELSIALLTIVFTIISLILIWVTSRRLNNIHLKRKMAEENFRTAVEAAPYALIISDSGGTITMVNDRTRTLYGYKKGELVGNNIKIIIPQKFHKDFSEIRRIFFNSTGTYKLGPSDEIIAKRKDGTEFPVEMILTPVKTSLNTYVLATVIDITESKRQQEIISKQVIELQQKNEELEQFNYISSHDLQEPLRTVSNYIGLIEEDYPDLDAEVKTHLRAIGDAISRMSHVVRSLLEFGRLGRKKKLVHTCCTNILNDVMSDLGGLIKSSGAIIEVHCDLPEFYAYETELRQLFQNLINNAIKFSRPGAEPRISISCKRKKEYYKFSISDNGIGISPEHFEKIFHIFHRLNSEDQYEGHGIGLANCKKIAEMHGGKIWVESEPGKGSTFKFTILNLSA